ncbi:MULTISPECIES: hypothetical protein [unclassified Streptomyces]|uniref:hypothetical protein n=1 Tax=unclassified Streptomyces TaxID=2593676 RepID=UPI000F5B8AE9|nr:MULTISPECIES: hypothetical protein [unclassified Streptomyces]WSG49094.1 hypothetical protein OHA38_04415 [Streptomyces sp. NBC_01732]WSW99746.1 hypothetical protein OG355_04545 [Streptomyces sp. NBC_00987]MCX4398487.1 hypothetical protein [Streptomyces sp. NBC_01767]MCX5098810.1 hypothetical protein [Streptomyces sp. NBC_00439]MCX5158346.1 hypothetical protein [Streptomyces sp. NBC_00305]
MSPTHTAMLLMAVALAVMSACLVAGIAFAVARWGGAPVPEAVARSGRAFASALTVISAVMAVVVTVLK